MLSVIDEKWKDHLYDLDQLRAAIQYRAWGQKDPLIEYKQEAYEMFVGLMHDIRSTLAERWLKLRIEIGPPPGSPGSPGPARTVTGPLGGAPRRRAAPMVASKAAADGLVSGTATGPPPPGGPRPPGDRKSTRLNSSHANISYAVFCLKKKKKMRKCRASCR